MRQGAQGWCTGMTLRDGMGRKVERASEKNSEQSLHNRFVLVLNYPNYFV